MDTKEREKDKIADSREKLILTINDLVDVARKSMQFNVVDIIFEEVLASALKIPVDDVKQIINSHITANLKNIFKFLPPSLFIKVNRRDNGWYGSTVANNGAVLTNYTLIDVGGDGSIHGIAPIRNDGSFDILDRDPPYEGGKILWNFAIGYNNKKIFNTDFVLSDDQDTITEIIYVGTGSGAHSMDEEYEYNTNFILPSNIT